MDGNEGTSQESLCSLPVPARVGGRETGGGGGAGRDGGQPSKSALTQVGWDRGVRSQRCHSTRMLENLDEAAKQETKIKKAAHDKNGCVLLAAGAPARAVCGSSA